MRNNKNGGAHNGVRDEKGHWRPATGFEYPPIFVRPWKITSFLKWLFKWGGFFFPRMILFAGLSLFTWVFLQKDLMRYTSLQIDWILPILLRNLILILLVYGSFHLSLYILRLQGDRGKYHPSWQAKGQKKFLFYDQVKDNIFYTLVFGLPIWTAWEIAYLWVAANGMVPLISFSTNPVLFISIFLIIPIWRDIHFYCIHRLLHWKPLLRIVHSVHHRNPNPAPWSGLSMHPLEHLLYFSSIAIHFVLPSHPIHMLFNAQMTALIPATVHTGFEGPYYGFLPGGDFFHYLHHKHVSCNFGGHILPLDRWFGRFYSGVGEYKSSVIPPFKKR